MNGLTVEQESAIPYLHLHQDDTFGQPVCEKHFRGAMTLRERGLIEAEADFSGHVYFQNLTSSGASHYDTARAQRRAFIAFDDDADKLALELAAEDKALKKAGEMRFVTVDEDRIVDYWTLKRQGLIDGLAADNTLTSVIVTDNGRGYAEGWFLDQMGSESGTKITNTFNPTISIDAAPRSESSSNSSVSIKGVSLTETLNAIRNIDGIDSDLKGQALKAAKDLDAASSTRDQMAFSKSWQAWQRAALTWPRCYFPWPWGALGRILS